MAFSWQEDDKESTYRTNVFVIYLSFEIFKHQFCLHLVCTCRIPSLPISDNIVSLLCIGRVSKMYQRIDKMTETLYYFTENGWQVFVVLFNSFLKTLSEKATLAKQE